MNERTDTLPCLMYEDNHWKEVVFCLFVVCLLYIPEQHSRFRFKFLEWLDVKQSRFGMKVKEFFLHICSM